MLCFPVGFSRFCNFFVFSLNNWEGGRAVPSPRSPTGFFIYQLESIITFWPTHIWLKFQFSCFQSKIDNLKNNSSVADKLARIIVSNKHLESSLKSIPIILWYLFLLYFAVRTKKRKAISAKDTWENQF